MLARFGVFRPEEFAGRVSRQVLLTFAVGEALEPAEIRLIGDFVEPDPHRTVDGRPALLLAADARDEPLGGVDRVSPCRDAGESGLAADLEGQERVFCDRERDPRIGELLVDLAERVRRRDGVREPAVPALVERNLLIDGIAQHPLRDLCVRQRQRVAHLVRLREEREEATLQIAVQLGERCDLKLGEGLGDARFQQGPCLCLRSGSRALGLCAGRSKQ